MPRYYLTFPKNVMPKDAARWIKRWGARIEPLQRVNEGLESLETESPESEGKIDSNMMLEGQLSVPIQAPRDIAEKVKELPGVVLHDNEHHQELY